MSEHGEAAAQRLQAAVDELIRTVEPLGTKLYHLPQEDEWSAMQNLAHVSEFMPFWARRAREVAEGRFEGRDYGRTPDEWRQRGEAVAYHADDTLDDMVPRLRAALEAAVADLRAIPEPGWSRTSRFEPGDPEESVAQIVETRVIGHVQAHLRQATAAASQD